jgi:hypothetical protein
MCGLCRTKHIEIENNDKLGRGPPFSPKWGLRLARPDLRFHPIPTTTLEKNGQRSAFSVKPVAITGRSPVTRRVHIFPVAGMHGVALCDVEEGRMQGQATGQR